MNELYKQIIDSINSSKEKSVALTSLDELSEYERHIIEAEIIALCKQGNKNYYQYIPHITTHDILTELLTDDFYDLPSIDMSLIYKYMYEKTDNPEYLSYIQQLSRNDIESFDLLVSIYLDMPKSNRKKNLLRQLCIVEGYATEQKEQYTELLNKKVLNNQTYDEISSSLKSRKLQHTEVASAFLGSSIANKLESRKNKNNDVTIFNIALIELLIKKLNMEDPQEEHLITHMTNPDTSIYSLTSMLPLSLYLYEKNLPEKEELRIIDSFLNIDSSNNEITKLVGKILCDYIKQLLDRVDKKEAYEKIRTTNYNKLFSNNAVKSLSTILDKNIYELTKDEIISSQSEPNIKILEVSLWSIINNDNYNSSITSALECETSISGAITGFLAGMIYSEDVIQEKISSINEKDEKLIELCAKYKNVVNIAAENSIPNPIIDSGFSKINKEMNIMLTGVQEKNAKNNKKTIK